MFKKEECAGPKHDQFILAEVQQDYSQETTRQTLREWCASHELRYVPFSHVFLKEKLKKRKKTVESKQMNHFEMHVV